MAASAVTGPGSDPVVARVGDEAIRRSAVDAPSRRKIAALTERLEAVLREALERSIDATLLARANEGDPPAEAVTEAQVEAFVAAHPEDFGGGHTPAGSAADPAVQREAARHYLERELRAEARAARLTQRRAAAEIERRLPVEVPLEPLPADRVLARVDGLPIRAEAVERKAALRLYRARGELYRERARNLETLVDERLLAALARRRGREPGALIEAAAGPAIDAQAIARYRAEEVAVGRDAPDPARARPYLEFRRMQQARERVLAEARSAIEMETLLSEPRPPRLPTDAQGAPALGSDRSDAPLLVVYANYRCRQCRLAHQQLDRLLETAPPPRIVLRDFIPRYDPAARTAAAWVRCAAQQRRHAALRRLLLAAEPPDFAGFWLGGADAKQVARRVGADTNAFARCVSDPATNAAIDRDSERARDLGFEQAPAFVAGGRGLSGVQSAGKLAEALASPLP